MATAKKVNIGVFEIEEILELKAPGARGPSVAELVRRQCRHSGEVGPEPAYLFEIDGSYVDVYEVEGEPMSITIRHADDGHEPDQAIPPKRAKGGSGPEYTFKPVSLTHPATIQPHDAFALKVVAIAGHNSDWAAYEGPANWPDEDVVHHGVRLLQRQAELLFYVMRTPGRHYGHPRDQVKKDDIQWRSLEDRINTRPCDAQDRDAFAVKVVAVAGYGDDWAAYEGPSGWPDEEVVRQGDKLLREQAEPLFPVMHATGRYYRP